MKSANLVETAAIKSCCRCGSGLLERDKFCRRCGARQLCSAAMSDNRSSGSASIARSGFVSSRATFYTTSALERAGIDFHRPVSGPLIDAVIAGVSVDAATLSLNRVFRKAILALISFPIWLMIILLSPLDAYAAAKAVSKEL